MRDARWLVIEQVCDDPLLLVGADVASVNGIYCRDGEVNGFPRWTKQGGTTMADSIYFQIEYGVDTNAWVITSGGTFAADPYNAKYRSDYIDNPGIPPLVWFAGTGGTSPAPTYGPQPDLGYTILRQVYPTGFPRFSEDEDFSNGLIAKRRKLTTDLVFIGDDYSWLLGIERDRNGQARCEEITVRHELKCDNKWEAYWTGVFSPGSGSWDFDLCQFSVRPEPVDRYTCAMRSLDARVNIMNVSPVTVSVVNLPSLEFAFNLPPGGPGVPFPSVTGWDEAHTQNLTSTDCTTGDPDTNSYVIWWRETTYTDCVAGVPVSPIGAGWIQISDCSTGHAKWARQPLISWTFGDAETGPPAGPGEPVTPPATGCAAWLFIGLIGGPGPGYPDCPRYGVYICPGDGDSTEYERERLLYEVTKYMLNETGCRRDVLPVSDFFEWNPVGDAPGYLPGFNYVTGVENQVDHITIAQKSDTIDPTATNPATLGYLTLRELFALYAKAFRVFWDIDDDGNFRFEHWRYWTYPIGLDLNTYPDIEKSEPRSYVHLTAEIPKYERAKWMEAQGRDFVGTDIVYSGPCVTSEGGSEVLEIAPGRFTTDIPFIIADPDSISTDGFTLMANTFNDDQYSCIIAPGALSGNAVTNAPLSWANLQRDFWTWDRFLFPAMMNNEPVVFDAIVPNIEQKNVTVRLCCVAITINSSHRVRTKLGNDLGNITAFVRRLEFDEATEWATLTLRYAY